MLNSEAHKEAFKAQEVFPLQFYDDISIIKPLLDKAKAYHKHGESSTARYHLHLALDLLARLRQQFLDLLPEASKNNAKKEEISAVLLLRLQKLSTDSARTLDEERYLWKENITIIKLMLELFQFATVDQNDRFGEEVLKYATEVFALQEEHYNKNEKGDDGVMSAAWVEFCEKTCLFREMLCKREALGVKDPKIEDTASEVETLQNPVVDELNTYRADNDRQVLAHAIGGGRKVNRRHASTEEQNELENGGVLGGIGAQPIATRTVTGEPPAWLGMDGYEKETEEWLAVVESSSSRSGSDRDQMSTHFEIHNRILNDAGVLTPYSESSCNPSQEVAYDLVELRKQFQKEERLHIAGKCLVLRLKHLEFVLNLYNTLPDDGIIRYAREIILLAKGKRKVTDEHFGDNKIVAADELRDFFDDVYYALKEYYLRLFIIMRVVEGVDPDEEVMNAVTQLLERVDMKKANK
jgi:hypothetical protein